MEKSEYDATVGKVMVGIVKLSALGDEDFSAKTADFRESYVSQV